MARSVVLRSLLFAIYTYLYWGVASLVPLFILLRYPGDGRYQVAVKVVSGVWLAVVLFVHLAGPLKSDQVLGPLYRRNRAAYVYIMLFATLMLWNPHPAVFVLGLVGFSFVSIGFVHVMSKVFRERVV
jgi:hypothetical protein